MLAFVVVSIHMAARGCESTYLIWDNVEIGTSNKTNEQFIRIKGWYRGKHAGQQKSQSDCFITGKTEVAILLR